MALAGLATIIVLQYLANVRLRAENELLQQEARQLPQLAVENEHLSNLLEQASGPRAAAQETTNELLRLRNEVRLLRSQTNELGRLRAENSRSVAGPDVPEVPPQDIFRKESWAPVGLGRPEATLQTWHWALLKGDATSISNCFSSPEDQARFTKSFEGISEAQRAARMADITGYRIIGQSNQPNGQVEVGFYYDGRGIYRSIRFEPVGNEWKLAPGQR